MAEYAGLEIRIGGNTTKLTNALKASTKSAAELQSRIRQITKAMQFDPTSLKNVETRIKITGDRMQSLQSKAQITRDAMEQLGDSIVTLGGKEKHVKDIASETENLSLKAKQADERYNQLTGTLAKIYEAWNKVSRSKGADALMEQLGFTQAEADYLMRSTTTLRDFNAEMRREQELRSSIGYNGNKPLISDADIENIRKFKELNFHAMFENGLGLDDVIQQAKDLGIVLEDSAIANVRELQKTFKDAQNDKEAFDKSLNYEQMGTDLQRIDSEVESLSQTMRKLDDGLTQVGKTPMFERAEADLRKVDAALDNVDKDLERTGEAMKADPKNIGLAARYFGDLQQKAELGEQKVALLNREMQLLKSSGAEEAAKGHQDLAKWVEESAESARKANMELSNQKATVANLEDEVKTLGQTIANLKGDSTLTQYSDGVLTWQKRTKQLNDAMEKLAKTEQAVANQQQTVGEAQTNFDKAEKEVEDYRTKLEALRGELKRLQDSLTDPNVSDETKFDNYNRIGEISAEISNLESAYKGAKTNAEQFNKKLEEQKKLLTDMQGDITTDTEEVERLKKSVSDLEKTRDVRLFQNPTGEIENMEGELVNLKGELDEAKAKEKELSTAYDSAKTENEAAKSAQAFRNVSAEANEAKAELKKAMDELGADKFSVINPSTVKSLGMTLSATLTPTISAIGYKMVDASATVDSAYRDMRKTVEGTDEQFETLRKHAIDFSRTHVTSADQILQIEAIGGELGIATENLETFAEVISNIDVATNLDVEGAANALGHLSNILHLSESDYVGFSDALVRLGNNGASTETEIANIAERIGSMGSIVGMSGSDILAWASTIASTGQRAEAAGTAISKTMSFMETAVAAAGGTMDASFDTINAAVEEGGDKLTVFASLADMTADEFAESWQTNSEDMAADLAEQLEGARNSLQKIADVAHMSADEFAKTWESDPTAALEAFIKGLNDIEGAEGSADKVLQDLGITAVRQKQAIEGLMQTVGGLDDNLKMSENAWNGVSDQWGQAGDAANEAAKKAEGFSGQIQILKNMAQNMLSELGEGAVPWIKMLSGQLETASQWFSSLSDNTKKWIVAAGGISAAIGPILSIGATFITAKKEVFDWFDEVTSGINLVKLAYKHGFDDISESAMKAMTIMDKVKLVGADLGSSLLKGLAVGGILAGIALITHGLYDMYKRYKEHIEATKGLSDAIAGIGKKSDVAISSFDMTGSSLRALADDSKKYESRLADLAKTLEDSNRHYGTYAGTMDYYAETISTLGDKSKLSKDESYKLEAALNAVNDACGSNYGLDEYGNIIDTETGKVQKNTDEILANIEARKQQALIDYYADDYTQAVGEHADAQEKLNEAERKYNDLVSDSGRRAYFQNAKKVYGSNYDEEKVLAAYNKELSDAQTAMHNYQIEVNQTGDVVDKLDDKIAKAHKELDKANKVMDEAAAAQEEFERRSSAVSGDVTGNMKRLSKAVSDFGGSDVDFNKIADGLAAIHVSADEMNDVDMSALVASFSDMDGSMEQIIATLEAGGVQMNTWNAALEQAPGAAENMSSLTAAAFQSMYQIAGQDINATMTLIAGLDMVQVGDKTFYIGDNGSIIDSKGKIYDIEADLASIPDEVITQYYVDDAEAAQKTLDAKAKLEDVNKQAPKPKIEVDDKATPKTESLQKKLGVLGSSKANPTANLRDNASDGVNALRTRLRNIDGMSSTVYITTVERTVKQATGGLNSRPVIPRHASGYIATGPTLTNQGWIGEDGIEAVANWATGGAVVPLTNRKYMLPIADAIADGMVSRGAGSNPIDYALLGQAVASAMAGMAVTIDGRALVGEVAKQVERTSRFYAG
jgi:chromosome segregation ATPase